MAKDVYVEPHELISSVEVEQIRKALIESHADLVVRGMLDKDVRKQLFKIVSREFNRATKGNPDVIEYVVSETIGTGVIEQILEDESVTDIGYNGSELIIESNDDKLKFESSFEISENYIVRLVNKFANANDKEFTSKNPIFDGRFENIRINAVHSQNTAPESGTTMSLRVVRPKLALTEKNFNSFAPMFIYDFLRAGALCRTNMVISGATGTGKTELHKLISRFIPFDDRILLIEDTPETFMKQMFPDKDVYSWVTSHDVSVTELIKAGLRNHPKWLMVTETRGSEAYEMIQAVLSGHSIITSLHATDARAIPKRLVNMAKIGYQVSEEALIDDIRRYFHFGIHIEMIRYKGQVVRYLREIIEFNPDRDVTIFKQRFVDGVFEFETFEIPEKFKLLMEERMVELDFPENFKSERALDSTNRTISATIPLDKTGRPDYEKIKKMGTTIDILMGREKEPFNPDEDGLDINKYVKDGYITPKTEEKDTRILDVKNRLGDIDYSEIKPKQDISDIEKDLQNIISAVKPKKETKKIERPKRKEKSVEELLKQKKKELLNEDV